MDTKSLLIGLAGFILGGLVVSLAAVHQKTVAPSAAKDMTSMVDSLAGKTGDDFDRVFISTMIEHHQGAIDMAKLAESRAKHEEIKALSRDIISAQEQEIAEMKQWLRDWGYSADDQMHMSH